VQVAGDTTEAATAAVAREGLQLTRPQPAEAAE